MLRQEVVDRLPRFGAGRGVAREVERQQIDALDQLVVVDLAPPPSRAAAAASRARSKSCPSRSESA